MSSKWHPSYKYYRIYKSYLRIIDDYKIIYTYQLINVLKSDYPVLFDYWKNHRRLRLDFQKYLFNVRTKFKN